MGAESFTVLAILEARDRASEIFAKVNESLGKFSESAKGAAETAKVSGEEIDAGLSKAAPGAERLAAAQERAAGAAKELAAAQKELRDATAAAGTGDADAAAQDRLATAEKRAADSAKVEADAQKELGDVMLAATGKAGVYADATGKLRDAQGKYVASVNRSKGETEASGLSLGKLGKVAGITALGMGIAGGIMVKAAGNFQDSTTHLVTDAGVSQKNLKMVQSGILQVSTATGQSAESITNAMYHIASSGFTAQNGLNILKVAAQGARVGGADLDTTSKTLVGTMTAYYGANLKAGAATRDSTSLMNQLVKTVSVGDMRMQDLASSLSSVTPVAAAAKVSYAQVGGAIATMTAQGMSARQATQNLANTIRNLKSPNNVASSEMKALGLNANEVSQNLGSKGLAGTLNQLRDAVLGNSKAGVVMLGYTKAMTPAAQGLANSILAGKISTGDLAKAVKLLNPEQARLVTQFKNAATSATGLKQTYTGAMSKMLGGSTGLNTALMLTGSHMSDLLGNTAKIAEAAKKTSGNIDGWSTIQGTFNFKLAAAKTAVENTGIAIGSALLPAATALLSGIVKIVTPIVEWTSKHRTLTLVLFGGVTALAATVAIVALTAKAFKSVSGAVSDVKSAVNGATKLLQKMGLISKKTSLAQKKDAAETAKAQEASAEEGAAAQKKAAAEEETSSGEAAAAQEGDAAEVAVANEEASAESSGSWVKAAGTQIASAAKWAGSAALSAGKAAAGYAASAAQAAGSWIKTGAQMIAKVAVVVASNIAGAAASAAAWIAANAVMLLGIAGVIALVAVAVIEIVRHWHTIEDGIREAWNACYDFISKVVSKIVSFVKSHITLLVAIVAGPLGLIVLEVVRHWTQIEGYFKAGVQKVTAALSWFIGLPGRFGGWLRSTAAKVVSEGERILRWFIDLPSLVHGYIDKLPGMMLTSGAHIIESLASGIESAAGGALHSAMSFVGNTIKSFLPFSPAKQGPLSGSGDPSYSGLSIAKKLASGLTSGTPKTAAAAKAMAASVLAATSRISGSAGGVSVGSALAASAVNSAATVAAGGGSTYVTLDVHDNHVMSNSDIDQLVTKIGKRLTTHTLPAAGRAVGIRG